MNLFETTHNNPWEYYTSSDVLSPSVVDHLNRVPLSDFYTQYTEQDEIDGNYDEKNILYHNVRDSNIVSMFTDKALVSVIESTLGVTLALKGVKLTLMSITGPRDVWVHPDSSDKIVSIIIYLGSDHILERGTWIYADEGTLHTKLDHIPNTSLVFAPNAITWHSCPEIDVGSAPRRSLMINYVDIPNRLQMIKDNTLTIPENVYKL